MRTDGLSAYAGIKNERGQAFLPRRRACALKSARILFRPKRLLFERVRYIIFQNTPLAASGDRGSAKRARQNARLMQLTAGISVKIRRNSHYRKRLRAKSDNLPRSIVRTCAFGQKESAFGVRLVSSRRSDRAFPIGKVFHLIRRPRVNRNYFQGDKQ